MTEDRYSTWVGDYLDGELNTDARRELEEHLESCESCRQLVAELQQIREAARALPRSNPPERIWTRLSEELRSRHEAANGSPPVPQMEDADSPASRDYRPWGAAAAVLLLLAGSLLLLPGGPLGTDSTPESTDELAQRVTEEIRLAAAHYENAIEGLERIVDKSDVPLSPKLSAVLTENLDLIESAIHESRTALSEEPESTVAQESLLEALRRKMGLLQNTILLINEVRKGEGQAAMDLIDEMRETDDASNPI